MIKLTVFDNICNKDLDILIGKNAKENWEILDLSDKLDYWFHLDEYPSCHVILQMNGSIELNKKTLIHCAYLCKKYSSYSNIKNISIIYTHCKNVKKSKEIGSVNAKNTKQIKI